MKILILHPYLSIRGGAEVVAAYIIGVLGRSDHSVRLLTIDAPEQALSSLRALAPSFTFENLTIEQAKGAAALRWGRKPAALLGYAVLLRAAKKLPAQAKGDFVFSTYGECDVPGKFGLGCYIHYPIFASGTGVSDRVGGRLAGSGKIRHFYREFCKFLAGYERLSPDTLCLTNSSWTANEIRRLIPSAQPKVVYCPVEPFISPSEFSAHSDPASGLRVLCLGRLVGYKGHREIVAALDAAGARAKRSYEVTFAGRGNISDRAPIEALATNHVRIHVEISPSRARLGEIISQSDVGVSAFWHEHFGIAVAELTASGLPVLVPDGGGQTEIVPDSRFIYKTQNELVDFFEKIATNPMLLDEMRQLTLSKVEKFSVPEFVRKIESSFGETFRHLAKVP